MDAGAEVYITDVGGSRSLVRYDVPCGNRLCINFLGMKRQAWVPYFQGGSYFYLFGARSLGMVFSELFFYFKIVNCILFLAPLAYNEVLDEDPRVNRLVSCDDLHQFDARADGRVSRRIVYPCGKQYAPISSLRMRKSSFSSTK